MRSTETLRWRPPWRGLIVPPTRRRSRSQPRVRRTRPAPAAVDQVIAGLLFMAGLPRSEAAALWRDVTDAREGDGLLVAVRRSKTNPDGETADVRFVKGDVARALRPLSARRGAVEPTASSASRPRPSANGSPRPPGPPASSRA